MILQHILKDYWQNGLLVTATLALMTLSMVSCEKQQWANKKPVTMGPADGGSSLLKVTMHDTAGPYAEVNVEILEASAHIEDTAGGAWIPLAVNAGIYNLLELQNGLDTVLANPTAIPGGGYLSQLRLILGDSNWVLLADSVTTADLKTPSGQESGIKINVQDSLQTNVAYDLILDFDANASVVARGNNTYLLKPVIKVDSLVEL